MTQEYGQRRSESAMTFSPAWLKQSVAPQPQSLTDPVAQSVPASQLQQQQQPAIYLTSVHAGAAPSDTAHGRVNAADYDRHPTFQALAKAAKWSFHVKRAQLEKAGFTKEQISYIAKGTHRDVNTKRAAFREGPEWLGNDGLTYCADPGRPGEVLSYDRNKLAFYTSHQLKNGDHVFDPYTYLRECIARTQEDPDFAARAFITGPQDDLQYNEDRVKRLGNPPPAIREYVPLGTEENKQAFEKAVEAVRQAHQRHAQDPYFERSDPKRSGPTLDEQLDVALKDIPHEVTERPAFDPEDHFVQEELAQARAAVRSGKIAIPALKEQYDAIRLHFKAHQAQQTLSNKLASTLSEADLKRFNDQAYLRSTQKDVRALAEQFEAQTVQRP